MTAIKDLNFGVKKIQKDLNIFTNDDLKFIFPLKTREDLEDLEDKCQDKEFGLKLVNIDLSDIYNIKLIYLD